MVLDLAPTWALGILLVLLLPAGIVVFAVAIDIVFLAEGLPDGWVWQLASVLLVAALAVLQAWLFRTIARNWATPEPEVRRRPVTTGSDTGI